MKDALIVACCALLLLACGFTAGYAAKGALDYNTNAAVQSDKDVCTSTSDSQAAALATLQRKLTDQAAQLHDAQREARAALDARDAAQAQIKELAHERATEVTRAGHENPDCADLTDMAICPAVAERLWPGITKKGVDPPASH